jgi:hypothetical protein
MFTNNFQGKRSLPVLPSASHLTEAKSDVLQPTTASGNQRQVLPGCGTFGFLLFILPAHLDAMVQ